MGKYVHEVLEHPCPALTDEDLPFGDQQSISLYYLYLRVFIGKRPYEMVLQIRRLFRRPLLSVSGLSLQQKGSHRPNVFFSDIRAMAFSKGTFFG